MAEKLQQQHVLTRLLTAASCKLQVTAGLRKAEGLSEPGDRAGRGREADSWGYFCDTEHEGALAHLGRALQHPAMERADTARSVLRCTGGRAAGGLRPRNFSFPCLMGGD